MLEGLISRAPHVEESAIARRTELYAALLKS